MGIQNYVVYAVKTNGGSGVMRAIISLAMLIIWAPIAVTPNTAIAQDKRVALVVGNSAYKYAGRLENPKHDATDMAALLRKLGFAVIEGRDLSKTSMDNAIRDFADALAGAQVGLFFYAGHGLQVAGHNYLMPIDAKLTTPAGLDFEMVGLDLVHRTMERETTTNIIILDACRDNPLARNLARALGTRSNQIGRGLATMESGEGTLISFSTQPGNVALDGTGRNSPFTAALIAHVSKPGEDLPSILINVRNDVIKATDRRQVPWEHSAMTARFYFTPPKSMAKQIELEFWASVKDSKNPDVVATYLERYPNGEFSSIARALVKAHLNEQKRIEEQHKRVAARDLTMAPIGPEKQTEVATPNSKAVLPPPQTTSSDPFDGAWRLTRISEKCQNPEAPSGNLFIRQINIKNGNPTATWSDNLRGSVSASGTFRLSHASKGRPGTRLQYAGTIHGNRGTGTFSNPGTPCHGTFTLNRT